MSLSSWWSRRPAGITFRFDEEKAAAAAAHLIDLAGGELNYLKLIKLLYLVDREGLDRLGRPITGDRFVSMKHGPVLSQVYNLIKGVVMEQPTPGPWSASIRRSGRYELTMEVKPDLGALSEAELEIIEDVFRRYGDHGQWELRDHTHELAEWEDPGDTSKEILPETILRILGKGDSEIEAVRRTAAESAHFESIFKK